MVCKNYLNLRVQRLWGRLPRTCSAWKTCSAPWEKSRWGTAMCCVTFLKRYSPACATQRRQVVFLPLRPPVTALRGRDWTTAGVGEKRSFSGAFVGYPPPCCCKADWMAQADVAGREDEEGPVTTSTSCSSDGWEGTTHCSCRKYHQMQRSSAL